MSLILVVVVAQPQCAGKTPMDGALESLCITVTQLEKILIKTELCATRIANPATRV